eukprot:9471055-Ditylum_brightwellii.AAC.1
MRRKTRKKITKKTTMKKRTITRNKKKTMRKNKTTIRNNNEREINERTVVLPTTLNVATAILITGMSIKTRKMVSKLFTIKKF